jgi:hypothetical protein
MATRLLRDYKVRTIARSLLATGLCDIPAGIPPIQKDLQVEKLAVSV